MRNAQTDRIVLWSDVSVVDCHWYLDGNLSFVERKSAVRPLKYLRARQNNDQKVLSAKTSKTMVRTGIIVRIQDRMIRYLPRMHGDEPTKLIAAYQLAKSAPYTRG